MKTLFKFVAWLIGLVILIPVVAAVAIPLFFDPNDFKDEMAQAVHDKTGRELNIEGDIKLSFFPWLGVEVGRVTFANRPGHAEPLFAGADAMELQVGVMPLFKGQVGVDTVTLAGLTLNLSRDSNGETNWQDLMELGKSSDEPPVEETSKPESGGLPIKDFSIGGLDVRDARIDWRDEVAGQHYTLSGLSLQTGVIRLGDPITLDSRFRLQGDNPPMAGDVALKGEVNFDPTAQTVQVRGLSLTTDMEGGGSPVAGDVTLLGDVAVDLAAQTVRVTGLDIATTMTGEGLPVAGQVAVKGTVDVDLAAQKLAVGGLDITAKLQGDIAGDVVLKGDLDGDLAAQSYRVDNLSLNAKLQGEALPSGNVELALAANTAVDLIRQTLSVADLNLDALGVKLTGTVAGKDLLSGQPRFNGSLEAAPFNVRELLQRLGQAVPSTADPAVLGQASFTAQFSASTSDLSLDPLTVKLDDTTLQGKLRAPNFQRPALRFDLAVNAIDADRYLPPERGETTQVDTPGSATVKTAATGELPLEPLRKLNIKGKLRIGQLKINKLTISNMELPLRAKNGVLSLSPASASLYGGSYQGNIGLDATGSQPKISLDETLIGIQAGPLLEVLVGEDRLIGTADASARLTMQGASADAIRSSLNGVARFTFKDGAYKGVNIGRMLRQAKAALQGKSLPADEEPLQTDFTELQTTINFANGVATNDDLVLRSPLLRITGKGSADLVKEQLDYGITATVVATATGQGGKELQDLEGLPVPIKVTGPFAEPSYALDMETLVKAQAQEVAEKQADKLLKKAEKRIQKELGEKLGEQVGEQTGEALKGEAEKLLKGLFGD